MIIIIIIFYYYKIKIIMHIYTNHQVVLASDVIPTINNKINL